MSGLARGCSHQEDVIAGHALLKDLLPHHLQQAVGHQHLEVSAGLPGQQNLRGWGIVAFTLWPETTLPFGW